MNILDRYIARSVLAAIGVVILVIGALLTLMLFISEVDNLGDGNYTFGKILIWMALMRGAGESCVRLGGAGPSVSAPD